MAKGVYGQTSDLKRLDDDGNLRYTVDFRSVYQEIFDTHLGVDAREILAGSTSSRSCSDAKKRGGRSGRPLSYELLIVVA